MDYYVAKSKIHGKGVFANKNFEPGDDIGHLVSVVTHKKPKQEYFTSELSESLKTLLERSELERYLNHSTIPNAECRVDEDTVRLFAIKSVEKDDEITVDYSNAFKILDMAQIIYRELHGL